MAFFPSALISCLLAFQLHASRRDIILLPTAAAAAAAAMSPERADAAPDEEGAKLRAALNVLDEVSERWTELTIDCKYGELRRELLSAENKEALLEEASSTSKAASTVTVCKSTGTKVRSLLEAADVRKVLERPALLERVSDDNFENFLSASERFQAALSAAAAAAFLAQNDYGAQTTFKKGEVPTTPNLDAARQRVGEARTELSTLCGLVGVA